MQGRQITEDRRELCILWTSAPQLTVIEDNSEIITVKFDLPKNDHPV